ncbi:MAG: hypothetical protein LAP21_05635 [Acidobacteriia bacterium]|nr:hypothetical protein [Terriglobia bacterium]
MKKSFLTTVLFLLAGSPALPAQQAGSSANGETSRAVASRSGKSDRSKHNDRSDRDGKHKKKDKKKMAPSKEEQEYDPTKGIWG